jgi:tetratricopeptide (TPR) repeat protein
MLLDLIANDVREQAIEDYTAALKLQPAHYKALHNRAFALDKVGRLEDAVADYTAAINVTSWIGGSFCNACGPE